MEKESLGLPEAGAHVPAEGQLFTRAFSSLLLGCPEAELRHRF